MMSRFFLIASTILFIFSSRSFSQEWGLEKINEPLMEKWILNSCEDLIWLSDVNSLDADNDGTDDFVDLKEKWHASYQISGNISFDPDHKKVDWNSDGVINSDDVSGFSPIGNDAEPFTGVFNGSYDTISNVRIQFPEFANVGLFGVIKNASIVHVALKNIDIISETPNTGGLVGKALKGSNEDSTSTIKNCFVQGEIINAFSGDSHTGGLVGLAEDVTIEACYSVMVIRGDKNTNKLGGFIGSQTGGRIENCYTNSWVSGNADVGTLIGYVDQLAGTVQIKNTYANGSGMAKESESAGGFIGRFTSGESMNCYWNPEKSSNNRAIGTSTISAIKDVKMLRTEFFSNPSSFKDWDFNHVWEMGDLSSKLIVMEVNHHPPGSIASILLDGQGDFDPWNKDRWADWYNLKGEIKKSFILNANIKFDTAVKVWKPEFSPEFDVYDDGFNNLFIIDKQGIEIDGNGITIDAMSNEQLLPLEELYTLDRDPWMNNVQLQAFQCDKIELPGTDTTIFKNITVKGFRRGLKIDYLGQKTHPILVKNCKFIRNGIGIYTNANSTTFLNCEILENGQGGIYSGSKSYGNIWRGNAFRDNTLSQHNYSYAEFIGDTYYNTIIEDNHFLPSLVDVNQRRYGISTFRNQGETENLREQMPHNNIIRNNHFDGYTAAIIMGSRMGRDVGYDITGEGRDYAFYNTIESNTFENTVVGIKINTEGNTIRNNQFTNVDNDIVLHCVFFKLKNTTIENQVGDSVKLWYVLDDYNEYRDMFKYEEGLNGWITKAEKRIEVHSTMESPVFPTGLDSIFVLNPIEKGPEYMLEDHRLGLPLATDAGQFSFDLDGEEIAAIWDNKISRVKDKDYYSILIFDNKGTEINRCGLSEYKWGQIAVGYFIAKSGEMEIAVVPAEPIDGKYPVYIFTRGFRVPRAILYQDNIDPSITISSGVNNELIVTF